MFDIGFLELIIVSVVGLLVLGPERLPGAIRTVMAYVNKIRRGFAGIRAEVERELQADEFRQDLHNQGIMQELKEAEKALRSGLDSSGVTLGKDGYPVDEPYQAPAPAAAVENTPAPAVEKPPEAGPAEAPDAEPGKNGDAAASPQPTSQDALDQDILDNEAPERAPRPAKP